MTRPKAPANIVTCLLIATAAAASAQSAAPADTQAKVWAMACLSCHGHNGKAEGVGFRIGGRPASELYDQMLVFRSGKRTATVMQFVVNGFSDDELKLICHELSTFR